ncbi:MAG: YggS family pyridoxal phosphate-dependent enzyme [Anaerolineae bacterium]|nr:YggS family pyridoxal phosphate-dependent enzyme [Anaerolineae bacterium]
MDRQTKEIGASAKRVLESIPEHVTIVAAAKTRTPEQVEAVIQAGITHIGHNYVQEAQAMIPHLNRKQCPDEPSSSNEKTKDWTNVTWHMIGHLQRNKVKMAVQLFDVIETVDSLRLAQEIDKHCAPLDRSMPILIEINSGREANKTGVLPDDLEPLVRRISTLQYVHIQGLMTMGPAFGDPENARPYFSATREAFKHLTKLNLPNVEMKMLSMGMSNSYLVAIQEGANVVRIGTRLFGPRP